MDLHLIPGATATLDERQAIERVLAAHPAPSTQHPEPRTPNLEPAPSTQHPELRTRHLLLPVLHALQKRVGWISAGALNYIAETLDVPPAEAYGVASFYTMLALEPRPASVVHVCDDIACRTRGAETVCRSLEHRLGKPGAPALDGRATWVRSPCLGQCDRAPAALFQLAGDDREDWTLTDATADAIIDGLAGNPSADQSITQSITKSPDYPITKFPRLLARGTVVDLSVYRANGGYSALARAIEIGREQVLREVAGSALVGRGGAAFPTGRKWEAVAHAPVRPHYLVCNADESEPGTFKDRVLMETNPFGLIESMTIAGWATGCEKGFIYIRGEYPLATARLNAAIDQARAAGLLGDRVMRSGDDGFRFDIELRRGAGAYICGEETALFNSIEGLRGEPRNKPPFPVQAGLFGKPTVVNNVETLMNVLDIVLHGGSAFAAVGTPASSGTKLFCVSGSVRVPGLYEAPFGITLRELINRAGGLGEPRGNNAGRTLQAVLLGGAAGVFVTPDEIDMPLTFEGTRAAGATLGSGAVIVFDDRVDLRDIIMRIAAFFRDESCGQCVPCRIGTMRQEEALHRLVMDAPIGSTRAEIALIDDLAGVMRDASICGLGHTASTAIQSAIRKFNIFPQAAAR